MYTRLAVTCIVLVLCCVQTKCQNPCPTAFGCQQQGVVVCSGCGQPDQTCAYQSPRGNVCGNRLLEKTQVRTCRDIYLHNPSSQSGEYTLFSNRRVYCRFSNGVITTYFSKSAADGLTTEELSHHYNTKSEVDVVAKWSNETQTVSKLAQLSRYSFLPLGITANEHTVYTAPMNLNLQPYLFVGFLPQVLISKSFINGYQANGMDKSFHNCDEGPNSQFTFYANPSNYQPQKRGWETHQVTSEWTSGARMIHSAQGLLPDDYFFDGELHFGGCGAYGITESWSKVHGLSLGVKYVLEHLVVPSC
ncbi:uncharacterized protein LOC124121499 isoform X1 [Haliotis rufescens]|uniref:uncharacterized protein LOC124121499 isoform X1 n=1 Tax=Haliotis rufescens TaxID=6454 RepID=UPI00201F899C|nr:uncharacterized protein LOC124121499 isoform X1 [Haliotis rufescens]